MSKIEKLTFGGKVYKIVNNFKTAIGTENLKVDSESRENYLTWECHRFLDIFTPSPLKMTSNLTQNPKNEFSKKSLAQNLQDGTLWTIYIRYQFEVRYDLCSVKVRRPTPKPKVVSSNPGSVKHFITTFFLFVICITYHTNLPLTRGWTSSNPRAGTEKNTLTHVTK